LRFAAVFLLAAGMICHLSLYLRVS
jgi:hypothetical protein